MEDPELRSPGGPKQGPAPDYGAGHGLEPNPSPGLEGNLDHSRTGSPCATCQDSGAVLVQSSRGHSLSLRVSVLGVSQTVRRRRPTNNATLVYSSASGGNSEPRNNPVMLRTP